MSTSSAGADAKEAQEGWQLGARDSAEAYERYAVRAWSRPLAERLVEAANPRTGERVLDVACGTGVVARLAAELVGERGSVVGLDVNESMLAAAIAAAATRPELEWVRSDASRMPFADGSFDLVTCQQGLQFFSDRGAVLREIRRVLAPGGRLALSVLRSLEHHPVWAALAEALERHLGAEAGETMRSPFLDLDAAELRELVTSAGFGGVRVRVQVAEARYPSPEEVVRWEAAASPLAAALAGAGEAAAAALSRDYAAEIRWALDDDGVVFPQQTYLATARR